jgi:hypothetical protein
MGCVVMAFWGIPMDGTKPEGWGGLTPGNAPERGTTGRAPGPAASGGGVCIFGGVPGGVFATGSGVWGGFLSFLPKEKKGIEGPPAWKACQGLLMVHYYHGDATGISVLMSQANGDFLRGSHPAAPAGVSTQIEAVLGEILQTLCTARRSGELTFRSGESYGYLFLQQGPAEQRHSLP